MRLIIDVFDYIFVDVFLPVFGLFHTHRFLRDPFMEFFHRFLMSIFQTAEYIIVLTVLYLIILSCVKICQKGFPSYCI